jgi:hypothetical protein
MWESILRKLEDLIKRVARLEAQESSRVVYLKPTAVRVLDDSTARAAAYTALVQVTGVTDVTGFGGTLPAKISGVWVAYSVLPTAVGQHTVVVKNPSDSNNPTRIAGYLGTVGGATAGLTFVSLDSNGQFRFTLNQGMNRTVWDVVAYVV